MREAKPLSRGEGAPKGREWNVGGNVGSGTQKQTWEGVTLQHVFAGTTHYVISRIPLPSSKPSILAGFESTFSPGEGLAPPALSAVNDNLQEEPP